MQVVNKAILALDVGEKRVGVAIAGNQARLAKPYKTLRNTEQIFAEIQKIVDDEAIESIIVGLPRGMSGQETAQTKAVKAFGSKLKAVVNLPLFWQDETLTSINAETELASRQTVSTKGDVDALAATYILEDYLMDNPA